MEISELKTKIASGQVHILGYSEKGHIYSTGEMFAGVSDKNQKLEAAYLYLGTLPQGPTELYEPGEPDRARKKLQSLLEE